MNKTAAAVIAGSVVTVAQSIGARSSPTPNHPRTAAWYAALRKPSFTPPGPIFGIAWTGLDTLLGYAGYRLLISKQSSRRSIALGTWSLNLLGIAGFSWVLFGRKRLDEALGVTVGMLATSVATVATAAQVDRKAAYASVPLFAWVVFASLLQEEIWRRNS